MTQLLACMNSECHRYERIEQYDDDLALVMCEACAQPLKDGRMAIRPAPGRKTRVDRVNTKARQHATQVQFSAAGQREYEIVKAAILTAALGTEGHLFHADMLDGLVLEQPNVVGAAVRALVVNGALMDTGDRRPGSGSSHGRRSNVYRLTGQGQRDALAVQRKRTATPEDR